MPIEADIADIDIYSLPKGIRWGYGNSSFPSYSGSVSFSLYVRHSICPIFCVEDISKTITGIDMTLHRWIDLIKKNVTSFIYIYKL